MSKGGEECGNEQHSKVKQTHRQTGRKRNQGRNERWDTKRFKMCRGNEACVSGGTAPHQTSHCPTASDSVPSELANAKGQAGTYEIKTATRDQMVGQMHHSVV